MEIWIAIWTISIIITCWIAGKKGQGILGFIIGCFYGPVAPLIALLSSNRKFKIKTNKTESVINISGSERKTDVIGLDDLVEADKKLNRPAQKSFIIIADYFKLLVAFLFLVSFKYLETACWGIVLYWILFSCIIFLNTYNLKKISKEIFLDVYLNKDGFFYSFLKGKFFNFLIALFISLIISASTLLFVYQIDAIYLTIIFIDIFLCKWIFQKVSFPFNEQFNKNAGFLVEQFFLNIINIIFMLICYFIIFFYTEYQSNIPAPPFLDIPEIVIQEVHHSCKLFQSVLRTTRFFDLNALCLKSIGEIGKYIYLFVYFTSLSIFPFTGITLLYKSAIKFKLNSLKR